jgi:monoterpene epsilon-lactone hydrolase
LAPILIQVGSSEVLLDDSLRLAKALAEADGRVNLEVWPAMIHVWHLFCPRLSEGRRAIAAGARFIRSVSEGG